MIIEWLLAKLLLVFVSAKIDMVVENMWKRGFPSIMLSIFSYILLHMATDFYTIINASLVLSIWEMYGGPQVGHNVFVIFLYCKIYIYVHKFWYHHKCFSVSLHEYFIPLSHIFLFLSLQIQMTMKGNWAHHLVQNRRLSGHVTHPPVLPLSAVSWLHRLEGSDLVDSRA